MNTLNILQFYSENNNFFNYLFLGAILILIILISIFWQLLYQAYIKSKDDTLDPHMIAELKPPSKIIFTTILFLLTASFFLFLQFFYANSSDNLSTLKYLMIKDKNVVFLNNKDIPHNIDTTIPLNEIETVFINNFQYSKYKNVQREYCQISFKFKNNTDEKEKNIQDLHNSLTLTIPDNNLIDKETCSDIAKKITIKINNSKKSLSLPTISLLKTTEQKDITYTPERDTTLYIQFLIRTITKPGSFFLVN